MVIGITGGIGSGKTTATEYLKTKGFAHVDVDQIGRDLTADGQPLLEIIGEEFGCVSKSSEVSGNGLILDRKALADIVFADEKKLSKYNRIIHTRMKSIIDQRLREYGGTILLDAPLLFETGIEDRCDYVILITADKEKRVGRVSKRDGSDAKSVKKRIASQMNDEEKAKLADFVVDNSGAAKDMYMQLDKIIKNLCLSEKGTAYTAHTSG